MGALSPVHWLVIALLLVLLLGYKRLPDVARGLGRTTRILKAEVKGMTSGGRDTPPRTPPDEDDDRRAHRGPGRRVRPATAHRRRHHVAVPWHQRPDADPAVLSRIAMLLRELAWCVPPGQHAVVVDQLTRLRATVATQGFDDHERRELAELGEAVEQALQGRWTSGAGAL